MELLRSYFLCFMVYSFIGWSCETAYCSYLDRHFINRGFLNGPFCPIYGAGALIAVYTLQWLPRSPLLIFFAGVILMSAVEYFTGWLLEVLFQTRWWDYSDQKFNIKGRVCLVNSICFGLMTVALLLLIHPAVWGALGRLQPAALDWACFILFTYLAADLTITLFTILKLNHRLEKISVLMEAVREKLDSYDWYESTAPIRERLDKLFENGLVDTENPLYKAVLAIKENIAHIEPDTHLLQKRLLRAFPKIRSLKYPEYLSIIRDRLLNLKKG